MLITDFVIILSQKATITTYFPDEWEKCLCTRAWAIVSGAADAVVVVVARQGVVP